MVYQQQNPLHQFEEQVSGFNCTIPTLWMANRFISTDSSAFMLSTKDKKSDKNSKLGKRNNALNKAKTGHKKRRFRKKAVPFNMYKKNIDMNTSYDTNLEHSSIMRNNDEFSHEVNFPDAVGSNNSIIYF